MINTSKKQVIIGIYKITSPTGRMYIGQSIEIRERWLSYFRLDLQVTKQPKLYRSFLKYGVKNHQFEIIEECPEEYLDELETWWKLYYNSVENGLNCSYWDCTPVLRGQKRSYETIIKISKTLKSLNRKRSEESINLQRYVIHQLDLNNNLIKEWVGMKNMCDELKFSWRIIRDCVYNRRDNYKGFKFIKVSNNGKSKTKE